MNPRAARLAFLVVSPAVFFVALVVARRVGEAPGTSTLYWDDDLRQEVQAIVEQRYVDPLDEREARHLFNGALEGYVGSLDPFSRFVPPEDRARSDQETQGTFVGIGVRAFAVPEGLRISAVRRGSPAEESGIEPGDVFEQVGGQPLTGRDAEAMLAMIRGEAGTIVEIVVRRGAASRVVPITRAVVPSDTVPSVRLLPGTVPVGYVRIDQFADTTALEVRDAVSGLVRDGAGAFVIDLRQNLGGVVHAAVGVASLFLPAGVTVCVARKREGGEVHVTKRDDGLAPVALPLVLLVDESSASASEILAGALQDHGRAVLVGDRTWGKFLVQTLVETRSGGGAVVKVTTARYETPRGRSAPRDDEHGFGRGLAPDVRVPLASTGERDALRNALVRQLGPHWRSEPRDDADADAPDRALDAALDLLRGGAAPGEPVAARAM